jgi:hypothetical protein
LNFIGHAFVALWQSREPRFVLGSMLPDFAGMAGARLASHAADDSALGRGIALHHRTDDVFHGSPPFVSLMGSTMDQLLACGVGRGPSRAIGHVGVEMLIDGELLTDPELARAYQHAVAQASEVEAHLFRAEDEARRAQSLLGRLSAHGVPYDYRNTEAVAKRLARMLADRPRLAITKDAEPHVLGVLAQVQPLVRARIPELVSHLRSALSG